MIWTRQEVERRYGKVYGRSGYEFKVECIACGTKAMWVNVKKNLYYCFSCGAKGATQNRVLSGSTYTVVTPEKKAESVLPEGFRLFKEKEDWNSHHTDYLHQRGVDPHSLMWGVAGDYCVFPVWHNRKIVYWQSRAIYPIKPKTRNPSKAVSGFGKSDVLFNYADEEGVKPRRYVLLVEGVFDALAVDGLAMLGKILSDAQAILISQLLPKKVYQILDADAGPETRNHNRQVLRRHLPFVPIFDVKLPDGDPASLGQAVVWSLITRSSVEMCKSV